MAFEESAVQTMQNEAVHIIPSGVVFCPLCNRYVSPKTRNFAVPLSISLTSVAGLITTVVYGRSLGDTTGYYTGFAES
ncbi:MAG: hypothetical protein ACXVIU_12680, partial [Halobacteriota archaeon]